MRRDRVAYHHHVIWIGDHDVVAKRLEMHSDPFGLRTRLDQNAQSRSTTKHTRQPLARDLGATEHLIGFVSGGDTIFESLVTEHIVVGIPNQSDAARTGVLGSTL